MSDHLNDKEVDQLMDLFNKIKYVLVETDRGQRWNVPGSHLTQIKEAVNA